MPNLATTSPTPFSTCPSSVTFIATAKASLALGLDLGGRCVCGVEIEVGDDGNAAFGGEAKRDLLADTACSTGDNRHSSIKSRHG